MAWYDYSLAIWTAFGTWVLVVGTLFLMWWQTRTAQKLNSANAVMALREQFDAPRILRARKRLAADLMASRDDEEVTIAEVATFLELVGTLTHRKILEEELVWEAFGSWVVSYWWGLRNPIDRIGRARSALNDPLIFHEFEWLYHRVLSIDVHRLGTRHAAETDSPADSKAILLVESKIRVE